MSKLADEFDRLRSEWSGLQGQWDTTRREWRDRVGDRFTREMWEVWETEVPKVLKAMSEFDDVLEQAIRRTS